MRRPLDAIERLLTRGICRGHPLEETEKRLRAGEKVRIYIGIDPTSRVIHLGHAVSLRKLREFQASATR